MDKIKLVIIMVTIIVNGMNCDTNCDCKTIKDLQEFMQKEILKMNFRLRRLEASKRHSTETNNKASSKESDGLSTTKSNIIGTLEAEVKNVGSTDVNKATILSRFLKLIETNLMSLSLQVQDLKKNYAKNVLGTIVKKTLSSEKRSRKKFESVLKNVVININNSFSEMKTETKGQIDKYHETILQSCDRSIEAMKEVTVNINKTINEEIKIITESLNDLTEELSDVNKKDGGWSSWENWGSCSVSCGGGIQSRLRTCSNPRPSLLGRYCDGSPDETRTCKEQQCEEFKVAFTAYNLNTSSNSSTNFLFRETFINYGHAYDASTGKFTCKVPGLYYFSVTLTTSSRDELYIFDAYIRINGDFILQLWRNSDFYNEFEFQTPLTHSGTFHLNKYDVVYIYGTPNEFIGYRASSFTGYLITPD